MAYDYGYGEHGNQLVELFRSGTPDFEAAEELIRQGADVNAVGKEDDENILSEILLGYWESAHGDVFPDACDDCESVRCEGCEHNQNLNPDLGPSMCAVIRFFLDHGFDVNKQDGCYGAQCLNALTLSSFDRYMIEATKILLDAGAKNRTVSPVADCDATPWSWIGTEASFQGCERNYALANIYEAVYQVYQAVEDGRPYGGIDSYEVAVGKKVLKVLAERDGNRSVFYPMSLPQFQKKNCFNKTLYFVYEGGALLSTQYADFWTDTILPEVDLLDVSEYFAGVVGSEIKSIDYDYKTIVKGTTHYGQPITTLEMDSGQKVTFSINFGLVESKERAAWFELAQPPQKKQQSLWQRICGWLEI